MELVNSSLVSDRHTGINWYVREEVVGVFSTVTVLSSTFLGGLVWSCK